MKRAKLIFAMLFFIIPALAACGSDGDIDAFRLTEHDHGYRAVGYIEFMNDNLYARAAFTYRELEAAEWIAGTLVAMGHNAENIELQSFNRYDAFDAGWIWHRWDGPNRDMFWRSAEVRLYSQNVVLTMPGQSESKIIVGAHYDTLPYPGASDNAGGVALLLESAHRMLGRDNYHTIVYVFFGAEEIGLTGAHAFLDGLTQAQRDNIVLMVNADVLFEGEFFFYGAGYNRLGRPAQNDVSAFVSDIALQVLERHDIYIASMPGAIYLASDQRVFLFAGHTVVLLAGAHLQPADEYRGAHWGYYGEYVKTGRLLHSERDCFHYINRAWPGKIDRAMHTFSIFLEELLMARYNF